MFTLNISIKTEFKQTRYKPGLNQEYLNKQTKIEENMFKGDQTDKIFFPKAKYWKTFLKCTFES